MSSWYIYTLSCICITTINIFNCNLFCSDCKKQICTYSHWLREEVQFKSEPLRGLPASKLLITRVARKQSRRRVISIFSTNPQWYHLLNLFLSFIYSPVTSSALKLLHNVAPTVMHWRLHPAHRSPYVNVKRSSCQWSIYFTRQLQYWCLWTKYAEHIKWGSWHQFHLFKISSVWVILFGSGKQCYTFLYWFRNEIQHLCVCIHYTAAPDVVFSLSLKRENVSWRHLNIFWMCQNKSWIYRDSSDNVTQGAIMPPPPPPTPPDCLNADAHILNLPSIVSSRLSSPVLPPLYCPTQDTWQVNYMLGLLCPPLKHHRKKKRDSVKFCLRSTESMSWTAINLWFLAVRGSNALWPLGVNVMDVWLQYNQFSAEFRPEQQHPLLTCCNCISPAHPELPVVPWIILNIYKCLHCTCACNNLWKQGDVFNETGIFKESCNTCIISAKRSEFVLLHHQIL